MKSQKITATTNELSCFITLLIATAYEQSSKRLNYDNLVEIQRRVNDDLMSTDFKAAAKEFEELLSVYQAAADDNSHTESAKGK
jgi:hypothetical protein